MDNSDSCLSNEKTSVPQFPKAPHIRSQPNARVVIDGSQCANDAGALMYLNSKLSKPVSHSGLCTHFLKPQFRVAVECVSHRL